MKTMKKELTVSELGRVFELFQKAHPECPFMKMEFDAFHASNGIRPSIKYGLNNATYIASYSTESVEELYYMMKDDVKEILHLE